MNMKNAASRVMLATFCFLFVLAGLAGTARGATDEEIMQRARQSYYNLKDEGLVKYRCRLVPDWKSMAKSLTADASAQELFPLLSGERFEVAIGPDGASSISHHSDQTPPNEQAAERLRKVTGGLEQTVTGFFQMWSVFMFNSPLPDAGESYLLEDLGERYRVTYKVGANDVVTTMTKDLAIDEMKVTTPSEE